MSDSPSPPPPPPVPLPSQQPQPPQLSDLPNPNPNTFSAGEDGADASQKSPIQETLKNPDQETQPRAAEEHKQKDCEELDQQPDQEEEEEIEDEEGINMPQSPLPLSSSTSKNSKNVTPNVGRNKKRKKLFSASTQNAKQRKMEALSEGFNPIPFIPDKVFDFDKHQDGLRKLGLWDFAHLQFDTNLKLDLLLQLVADSYPKAKAKAPYVNEFRMKVSRADLARALKLPVKKPSSDCEGSEFSAEFLSFLEDFVSSWMLLQVGDVWVTPNEIVNWMKLIKDGEPHKVDWAGLIWFMVEKELAQGTKLRDCYYASHLQQLIKDQRPQLLANNNNNNNNNNNKVVEEVIVQDDEEGGDTEMLNAPESSLSLSLGEERLPQPGHDEIAQKDDDDDDANLVEVEGEGSKLKEVVDGIDKEKNESNVASMEGLCEGGETGNIDDVECAENENVNTSDGMSVDDDTLQFGSERNWLNGVNDEGHHVMQRCSNMSGLKMPIEDDGGCEDVQDEVGEDDEQGFKFMEETTTAMNEMTSRNLMQAIETGHLPYNTSVELGGQSSLGFLPSKAENDVMLDGTSLFDHAVKREIDHEHDISHHALDENHKRMRYDGHWDHKPPDFGSCMDQLFQWAQKTKIAYETEKDESYQQLNMAQMFGQGKENEVIQWRCKYDELQRKFHTEVGRRDRELHLMNNVIDGYRRALKDSQKAFSEYRKRCQIPDEPIYKDVGSGGVMKSIKEVEKEEIKKEEENMRRLYSIKHEAIEFEADCVSKLQGFNDKVMLFDERLKDAAKNVEVVRHLCSKRKMLKTVAISEEVESEAQEVEKEDLMKHKISENVSMSEEDMSENVSMSEEDQSEAVEVPKEDVESKISENAPMVEEGEHGEAQEIAKDDGDDDDDGVEPKMCDNSVMPLPKEVPGEARGLTLMDMWRKSPVKHKG